MDRKFNILFWAIISLMMLVLFGLVTGNFIYSFYFLSFFIPVIIYTSWLFNQVLVPRYLLRKSYTLFITYTIYLLIISLDLELIFVFLAFLLIEVYDIENLSMLIDSYKWMPVIIYLIVLLYGFVNLISESLKRQNSADNDSGKTITVRANRQNRIIHLKDIGYIESMADYIKIICISGEIVVTREKISHINARLPEEFLRIHRSFIINRNLMESYTKEFVVIHGTELPISRTYKKELEEKLY